VYGLLNEKTLELNITAEFLRICRQYDPQAYTLGTTLVQESHLGYDSRILGGLPPFWRTAVFQFKRATRIRLTLSGPEYKFQINNNTYKDQHLFLWLMCGGRPHIAFYVLPCFTTLRDVRKLAPSLVHETYLVDVADIPTWFADNVSHTLLAYPKQLSATVLSERREIRLLRSQDVLENFLERQLGITIEQLLANIRRADVEGAELRSSRSRFLFGIFPR